MKMTKKAITLSLGLVVMGSASFAQNLDDAHSNALVVFAPLSLRSS
jgi:hypothetical protein